MSYQTASGGIWGTSPLLKAATLEIFPGTPFGIHAISLSGLSWGSPPTVSGRSDLGTSDISPRDSFPAPLLLDFAKTPAFVGGVFMG